MYAVGGLFDLGFLSLIRFGRLSSDFLFNVKRGLGIVGL